jgi:hypothetical protein
MQLDRRALGLLVVAVLAAFIVGMRVERRAMAAADDAQSAAEQAQQDAASAMSKAEEAHDAVDDLGYRVSDNEDEIRRLGWR